MPDVRKFEKGNPVGQENVRRAGGLYKSRKLIIQSYKLDHCKNASSSGIAFTFHI